MPLKELQFLRRLVLLDVNIRSLDLEYADMDNTIKAAFISGVAVIVAAVIPVAFTDHWFSSAAPSGSPSTASSSTAPPSAAPSTAVRSPANIWVAQLASVPISAGNAQIQQALDEVRSEVPGAEYLNSSDYASLNPGYWMIYYAGSFTNGEQALAYCSARGRATREQCIGRFLSHNPADRIYMCFPPVGNQTADCSHP